MSQAPNDMSQDQRLHEIAEILVAGLRRLARAGLETGPDRLGTAPFQNSIGQGLEDCGVSRLTGDRS